MPKYFALKTYRHWINRNGHRFRHRPIVTLTRWSHFLLSFSGVTPRIRGTITKSGSISIWAEYQGECWDFLVDFDLVERRNDSGQYFCGLCSEPTLYQARPDLWIGHSFEPLLEWCNENLAPSQWLCIHGIKDRYTCASLAPTEKLEDVAEGHCASRGP